MFYPVTTQQSGEAGACETQRSPTLVKSLVRTAFRGEPLFRSLRPDFIETCQYFRPVSSHDFPLFWSLRVDFIEARWAGFWQIGLSRLFRSLRPEFMET